MFMQVDGKPVKLKAGTVKRRKGGGRKPDRKKFVLKGKRGTKPGKLLKKHIAIRAQYPWNERKLQTSVLRLFRG
jgi:hypothetical protein